MLFVFEASDGNDLGLLEGWYPPQLCCQITAINVGHDQIDEHQVGLERVCNIERLSAAIGDVHLIAERLNEQAKRICPVAVVVHDEDAKGFVGCGFHEVFVALLSPSPRFGERGLGGEGLRRELFLIWLTNLTCVG